MTKKNTYKACIVNYVDEQKRETTQLLTNDHDLDPSEIVAIYETRWIIEAFFRQLKQNFPLKYLNGESANAIKVQVWVMLIANYYRQVKKTKRENDAACNCLQKLKMNNSTSISIILCSFPV